MPKRNTMKDNDIKKEETATNDFNLGLRIALVLSASILAGDVVVILIVSRLKINSFVFEALVDAFMLLLLTFPSLYFFVIRPFNLQASRGKQAEQEIKESEKRYRTLFELSNDAIFMVDLSTGNYLDANKAAEILTGRAVTELKKLKTSDITPLNADKRLASLRNTNETINLGEVEYLRSDGTTRIALVTSIPINKNQSFGFAHDISERKRAEEALLKSEAHLQTLLKTIPDLIWLKDPAGVYISCNTMFERLVGTWAKDLAGKTDYDLFSRENAQFFRENDQKAMAAGKPTSNEEWLTFIDDGHHALFDVIKTPMYDSMGTLIGVLGIGHDITHRKRMEVALTVSEEKFSKAFQLSPYAITLSSAKDGKLLEINDAFVTLSGFAREEALGHSSIDMELWVNLEDRSWVISTLLEGRGVQGKEFQFKKRNGEIATGLYSAQVIQLNNEPYMLSSINDITDRKLAEEALRESEEKYRYMFANNPQPMWIYDLETLAFLEVNHAAITHYGYSKEEFSQMTVKDIRPAEDVPKLIKDIREINTFRSPGGEWKHIKKNGEVIFVEITAHSVAHNGNKARHVLVHDITDRKRAETEITLKNMQLIQAHAEKDKFFSIIAHDLRNPLSSFLRLTQIMDEEFTELSRDQIQQFTQGLRNSASNLYRLLENLLQWARLQRGLIPFNPKAIHLRSMIDESIAIALEPAKNKGIELTYTIPDELNVYADTYMLQTVIRNLVSNAMKFTSKGGKISLSAKTNGDNSIEISIADTGIGMNKSMIENLFRPDVQTGRPGTEGEPSSGFGLLLCKEFIEKHGGKIGVESEVGNGSAFYFTIPCEEAPNTSF